MKLLLLMCASVLIWVATARADNLTANGRPVKDGAVEIGHCAKGKLCGKTCIAKRARCHKS
jgi:hypothetical protein